MRTRKATTTLITLGLAFVASTAHATLIVSDNFNNAVMNNGVLESALNYGPATATSSHTLGIENVGPGNQAMLVGDGSGSIYLTAALPQTISLDNVGDFIQMDFQLRTEDGERGNRVLRYGFFQGGENNDDEALGYFVAGGNRYTSGDSSNSKIGSDTSTSANPFYTDGGGSGGTATRNILDGNTFYDVSFRIERISVDALLLTAIHAGTNITSNFGSGLGTDSNYPGSVVVDLTASGTTTTFNEIWFGVQNRSTDFAINNLQISAIPEPSTLFLVGSVLIGFLLVNKTRRR